MEEKESMFLLYSIIWEYKIQHVAGFTGKQIEYDLIQNGCNCDFIHLSKGFSRINVKLKSKQETEINGIGPEISEQELKQLFEKLDTLQSEDILILAGSVPATLPKDIYENIMAMLQFLMIITYILLLKKRMTEYDTN